MGSSLGVRATGAQAGGEPGELPGGGLGYIGGGLGGAQTGWGGKDGAQDLQRRQRAGGRRDVSGQAGQIEAIDLLGRSRKVGVDLEAIQIADDEQRRVLQVLAVLQELLISSGQVLVGAFVLPGVKAALPDIGEAPATAGFGDAALKGVRVTMVPPPAATGPSSP